MKALTRAEVLKLNLYSDPTCAALNAAIAKHFELQPEHVVSGNGSDEVLAFAFRAFCGEGKGVAFADITYGFYKSQVALFGLEATRIPLREDFTLNVDDYMDFPGTIVIANPNAPTGIAVPRADIQRLLEADPDRVVIVDEAYVDFGAESCVPMIFRYDNLLVVQTMSKSRSLAGGRVGYALGSPALIEALNRVKYSFHPYNVNRLSMLAGAAAVEDDAYFQSAPPLWPATGSGPARSWKPWASPCCHPAPTSSLPRVILFPAESSTAGSRRTESWCAGSTPTASGTTCASPSALWSRWWPWWTSWTR